HLLCNTRAHGLGLDGANDRYFWDFVHATNPPALQAAVDRMRSSNLGRAADYLTSIPNRERFVKFEILRVVNAVRKANREKAAGEEHDTVPRTHMIFTNNRTEGENSENVTARYSHPLRALEHFSLRTSGILVETQLIGKHLSRSSDALVVPLNEYAAERFVEQRRNVACCKVEAAGPEGSGRFYVTLKSIIYYVDIETGECACGNCGYICVHGIAASLAGGENIFDPDWIRKVHDRVFHAAAYIEAATHRDAMVVHVSLDSVASEPDITGPGK
ncbi:hypothetical protein T484DRAFT_1871318, partial [Baffinella frigidus]